MTHIEICPSLLELARREAGPVVKITDRSWPRDTSVVFEITNGVGERCFVKRHASARLHDREVAAYQHWTAALGPGRTPRLLAAERSELAIVLTSVPGEVLPELGLSHGDEREAFHQAGGLLRRLHESIPPRRRVGAREGIVSRAGKHLIEASGLLELRQADLVRELCAQLAQLAPGLAETPAHGDAQPRNFVWDAASRRLALIDFERADWAPPVRDLARLEYGAWDDRPDLRMAFFDGYGRAFTDIEERALRGFAALDAVSGIRWGTDNDDAEVTARSRRALTRLTAASRGMAP